MLSYTMKDVEIGPYSVSLTRGGFKSLPKNSKSLLKFPETETFPKIAPYPGSCEIAIGLLIVTDKVAIDFPPT